MKQFILKTVVRLRTLWNDKLGQDMIEYALMAGFVALAAGTILPGVASSLNVVFEKTNSIMIRAQTGL